MRIWSGLTVALVLGLAGCAPRAAAGVALAPATFSARDTDRNGCLDESEFGVGWDDEFRAWDADGNRIITVDEWRAGIGANATAFEGPWDTTANGFIDESEFDAGSFRLFDTNKDNCIGVNEWNAGIGLWKTVRREQ